jgi:hypothetical protein
MARQYAQVVGIVVVLLGLIGLIVGEGQWLGLLNVDLTEDIIHLITGGLLIYAGFQPNASLARTIVGVLGVVYLLVGILGFVSPTLFGLIPGGYTILDNLVHLILGILGIAIGWFLTRETVVTS